ncbi:hypothetical protein [Algoriphagus sp.]|nr:hypothetical protein [Algoriphagus sp.]
MKIGLPKIFTDRQWRILKDCRNTNQEEEFQWRILNILIPFVVILLPSIAGAFFKIENFDFFSKIFNGSVSLLGINILLTMSSFLINVTKSHKNKKEDQDEGEDDKLDQDVLYLRGRLDLYRNILLIIGIVCYISPIIFSEYVSDTSFYVFTVFSFFVLVLSVLIGNYMFIIKDDFFKRTFYSEISETVISARNNFDKKF